MVDSNVASAASTADPVMSSNTLTPSEATSNMEYLRTQAESWLAVLFNVFGSVGRDGQGMVGDVISSWASVAGEQVCQIASFRNVSHPSLYRRLPRRMKKYPLCSKIIW
jgi:hypothetical protein